MLVSLIVIVVMVLCLFFFFAGISAGEPVLALGGLVVGGFTLTTVALARAFGMW